MRRVVITGLGTVNALGLDVESSFPRILAGENGITTLDRIDTEGLSATIAGQVDWNPDDHGFDVKERRKLDPFTMWGIMAAGEALRDADKFFGSTVIIAARVASEAAGGEILASSLLKQLTESVGDLRFGDPRDVTLKGFDGTYTVFPVEWS